MNAFVYKNNITQSIEDCENLCVEDDCCRSFNYRKFFSTKGEKFCELFHTTKEQNWELGEEQGYRHSKLKYPDRVRANKTFYIIL